MPVNDNMDVNFSHNTHLYFMSKDRLVHITEKFILHDNQKLLKDIRDGVCVGLTYYIANVRHSGSQQGEKILLRLKELIYTLEMPISESCPPLVRA
ncbi:MAG TPA: hypothetical protein ACHBX0_14065 [Arsenophonus sp.]